MNHVEGLVTPHRLRPYLAHKTDLSVQDILSNHGIHRRFSRTGPQLAVDCASVLSALYPTCLRDWRGTKYGVT
jgi:hypothetical protein